jgi:hypothetical protein
MRQTPRRCSYRHCSVGSIPYDAATVEFRQTSRPLLWDIKKHYDKELYDKLKKIIINPYFEELNLAPITREEKIETLKKLRSAESAGAMFYDSYILQGNLYNELHKSQKAGKSYQKAIITADHDVGIELKKKARFLSLPIPVRKSISLLRKITNRLNTYYGYA